MRSDYLVFHSLTLDQHLCLEQRVGRFSIEQLIPEHSVERFHTSVVPRTARLHEQRRHPNPVRSVAAPLRHGGKKSPEIRERGIMSWPVMSPLAERHLATIGAANERVLDSNVTAATWGSDCGADSQIRLASCDRF